jgi:hypothetical protein
MSTESGTRDHGRFDELAEEFAQRYRPGERPSLREYIDRLPELANETRELLRAMVKVEQADDLRQGDQEKETGDSSATNPPLTRVSSRAGSISRSGASAYPFQGEVFLSRKL